MQRNLFDTTAPEQYDHMPLAPAPVARDWQTLKVEGMAKAAASKESQLGYARELAFDLASARPNRCITADEVAAAIEAEGRQPLGNAMGSLFMDGNWEWTGELVKSVRPHAHQNLLRVWKRKVQG
jgi:hypothetical protein